MIELLWAGLVLIALAAVTATVLVPWTAMVEAGQSLMLGAASVGIPLEFVYFVLLGVALTRTGMRPAGWYWASFQHHHLLDERTRLWVMPWFYAGALAFACIALGILLVGLGFVAAFRQL